MSNPGRCQVDSSAKASQAWQRNRHRMRHPRDAGHSFSGCLGRPRIPFPDAFRPTPEAPKVSHAEREAEHRRRDVRSKRHLRGILTVA